MKLFGWLLWILTSPVWLPLALASAIFLVLLVCFINPIVVCQSAMVYAVTNKWKDPDTFPEWPKKWRPANV